jgi:hypothetical protein
MLDPSDPLLYAASLDTLRRYKRQVGRRHRGRFVQLFLALKFYQNQLPSMTSGQFVLTEVLQGMVDELFAKASRPLNDCVLMLFMNRYLPRTGVMGLGRASAANLWRNNFNLQKGVGCYADSIDLSNRAFLDQDRILCRHLRPQHAGQLNGATCSLCATGATYRREQHRKWLQIHPNGGRYAVVDLMNVSNFEPYVAPGGARIPAVPMLAALYHDAMPGLRTSNRRMIDLSDFAVDFGFSANEIAAYFDTNMASAENARLAAAFPNASLSSVVAPVSQHPAILAGLGANANLPPATQVAFSPRNANTGWEAEQYVATALSAAGWTAVHDVSRQQVGYDLLAQRGRETRFIEVKSSLGYCTPTLTELEWRTASAHPTRYVLAVLENFNPTGTNEIFWIPNPASLGSSPYTTLQHSVARTSWQAATVPLHQL